MINLSLQQHQIEQYVLTQDKQKFIENFIPENMQSENNKQFLKVFYLLTEKDLLTYKTKEGKQEVEEFFHNFLDPKKQAKNHQQLPKLNSSGIQELYVRKLLIDFFITDNEKEKEKIFKKINEKTDIMKLIGLQDQEKEDLNTKNYEQKDKQQMETENASQNQDKNDDFTDIIKNGTEKIKQINEKYGLDYENYLLEYLIKDPDCFKKIDYSKIHLVKDIKLFLKKYQELHKQRNLYDVFVYDRQGYSYQQIINLLMVAQFQYMKYNNFVQYFQIIAHIIKLEEKNKKYQKSIKQFITEENTNIIKQINLEQLQYLNSEYEIDDSPIFLSHYLIRKYPDFFYKYEDLNPNYYHIQLMKNQEKKQLIEDIDALIDDLRLYTRTDLAINLIDQLIIIQAKLDIDINKLNEKRLISLIYQAKYYQYQGQFIFKHKNNGENKKKHHFKIDSGYQQQLNNDVLQVLQIFKINQVLKITDYSILNDYIYLYINSEEKYQQIKELNILQDYFIDNCQQFSIQYKQPHLLNQKRLEITKISNLLENEQKIINQVKPDKKSQIAQISLEVKIQGYQQLSIYIYELDTYNFYQINDCKINEKLQDLNIEGLQTINQKLDVKIADLNEKQKDYRLLQTHQFQFSEISLKRRGVYLIEIRSEEYFCRAVFKKGYLGLDIQVNEYGNLATILDENNQPLKKVTDQTGIYFSNQFLQADEKAQVQLPFLDQQQQIKSNNFIVLHDNFAQLYGKHMLYGETYKLNCQIQINNENIVSGNKAKILVFGKLYNSSDIKQLFPLPIDLIKNLQCEVILTNIKDTKTRIQQENFTFFKNQLSSIEFDVPSQIQLKSFEIKIKGEVTKTDKNKQELEFNHLYTIDDNKENMQKAQLFLEYCEKNGYFLQYLGKNQEKLKNQKFKITFKSFQDTTVETVTNEYGQIQLGFLNNIVKIQVKNEGNQQQYQQNMIFRIQNHKQQQNRIKQMKIHFGEEFEYNMNNDFQIEELQFYRIIPQQINNLNQFIEQIDQKNMSIHNKILKVKTLMPGQYRIFYKDQQIIQLEVLRNLEFIQINNQNYIQDEYKNLQQDTQNLVTVEDIQLPDKLNFNSNTNIIQTPQLKLEKTKVKTKKIPDNLTAILTFHNFYDHQVQNTNQKYQLEQKILIDSNKHNQQLNYLQEYLNVKDQLPQIFNNGKMSSESLYVQQRQKLSDKQYPIGNSLQKPSVFMNSTFYQETYTQDENMGIKQNLCQVNLYHKPESVTYQQHSQIRGKGVVKSIARRSGTRTKQTARMSTGSKSCRISLNQNECLNDEEDENNQEEQDSDDDDDSCVDLPLNQDKIREIRENLSEEECEDSDESSSSSSSYSSYNSRRRSRSPVYRGRGRDRDRKAKKKQKKSKRNDIDHENDEIYNIQLDQVPLKQPHRYRPQMKKKILCQEVQNISHSGTNFYNFLEQGAIILENISLKLDHDKGYQLNLKDEIEKHKINLKKFRYLTLQISDGKDRQILKIYQISSDIKKSSHQLNPLNNFKEQKLLQPYDKNYIYFINREDYPLYIELEFNENKDNILQITNLKEIFDIILQLSQQKKVKNQAIKDFTEWKFLYDWHTFTDEQKFEKLTQYFSHELSFFLALRDPQFFQQKVKNLIKMKTQKQIIDFYLLENWQQFKKLYDFQIYGFNKIQTFNFFEICLILDFEVRINKDKKNIDQIQFYLDQFNKSHSDYLNLKQQELQQVWDSIYSYKQLKDKQTNQNNVKSKNKEKNVQQYLDQNRAINQLQVQQQQIQQGYKNVNKTKQYLETHYYQNSKPALVQNLITFNQFWFELANHIIKKNGNIQNFISSKFFDFFLTKNFAQNFKINQILLITILTSLQINSKSDQQEPSQNQIIFEKKYLEKHKKTLQNEKNNNQNNQIIVNQYITNPENDTYTDENNIKQIKTVEHFETLKIYTLNTRLVNASFSNLIVNILLQIPEGAVQLGHNLQTDNIIKELKQLQTFEINIPFYFPETGKFKLYPASAIINNTERVVGIANEITNIKVEDKIVKNKLQNLKNSNISFEELVYQKEFNIIIEKLPKNELSLLNIPKKSLEKFIDFLKNNKAQFEKIKPYLQTIPNLQKQVLKLLLHHKDFKNLIHWFHDETLPKLHYKFNFKYFKLNNSSKPICDNNQYFEFTPLIQKRVMSLNFGQDNNYNQKILNQQFRQEYSQFLYYLGEKNNNANLADYLMLVYYLILQENISQAKIIFDQNIQPYLENNQQIDTENEQNLKEFQVQIDYIAAYLDIYYGYPKFEIAFEISKKYLNFSLLNWRNMFISVYNYLMDYKKQSENKIQQLDVYQGQELQKLTNNNLENYQFQDEHFTYELDSEKSQINLKTKNISELIIKAYNINVELLFSVNPFEISYKEINLKTIRCFKPQQEIKLPIQQQFGNQNEQETIFKIPKDLQNSNILFTLKSNNDTQSVLYSKSSLQVDVYSKMGQILVQNKGKKMEPCPKVYVKVFAKFKQNQSAIFYRDGYTDLNGRFDYAISSVVNDITSIDKFAIFVSKSLQDGCFITIVDPPSTLNQIQQNQNSLLMKRAMNSLGNLQFENENGRKIQKQ